MLIAPLRRRDSRVALAVCPWSNAFSSTKHHLEATHVLYSFCLRTTALRGLAVGCPAVAKKQVEEKEVRGPAMTIMPK